MSITRVYTMYCEHPDCGCSVQNESAETALIIRARLDGWRIGRTFSKKPELRADLCPEHNTEVKR